MKTHDLLDAREEKIRFITSFIETNHVVITIKANIPGIDKNIKEAYILCHLFSSLLSKKLEFKEIINKETVDGPIIYMILDATDINLLKKQCIKLEESHPLGRFIDLDCYDQFNSISRKELQMKLRKCYLCDEPAFICAKKRKHTHEELIDYVKTNVRQYIHKHLTNSIHEAMIEELNFDFKFGCVSQKSSGSHIDMNIDLMKSTIPIILPYLLKIFELIYKDHDDLVLLKQARIIGIEAEQAMFEHTKGINTYKGLIFLLGFFLLALGKTMTTFSNDDLFNHMIEIAKPIKNDFLIDTKTQGMKAYQDYHMLGIRGEVLSGLSTLRKTIDQYPYQQELNKSQLLSVFVKFIIDLEDTVFLKRAKSLKKYEDIKNEFRNLDLNDSIKVNKLNQKMIDQHLSFGGSADMLVLYILIFKLNQNIFQII